MQKKKAGVERNYIRIFRVDPENHFEMKAWKTLEPGVPQIMRILYKKDYGLIMACYRGYIQ